MSKEVRLLPLITILIFGLLPRAALAEAVVAVPARVLITEIQTEGPTGTASEDFVEITNVSSTSVEITNWKLQTKATGLTSDWTTRVTLIGTLFPNGSMLLSLDGYLNDIAAGHFSTGLSTTGGHLRILATDTNAAEDKVGWGSAADPEGTAAPKPTKPNTLSRKIVDGAYVDTNNNFDDFILGAASPSNVNNEPAEDPPADPVVLPIDPVVVDDPPVSEDPAPVDPAPADPAPIDPEPAVTDPTPETPTSDPTPTPVPDVIPPVDAPAPIVPTVELLPPQITELFPDPAAPQTDADDEYVELYNPNSSDLALTNYRLQTGSTFSHSFALDGITIPATTYLALKVSETNLVLSNSGGASRIVTPAGDFIEVVTYGDVKEGESYAFADGIWQWTTTVTPSAENIITSPPIDTPVIKTAVAKIAKTTTPKATAAKTTTVKAATTAKTTAKKATASTDRSVFEDPAAITGDPPIHPAILVGVGVVAVLYAGYEYREDLRNKLFKLRVYIGSWFARRRESTRR